jgi:hypothetical protein
MLLSTEYCYHVLRTILKHASTKPFRGPTRLEVPSAGGNGAVLEGC